MIELINGDCLEEMDKLIERGVKVDAIITDPPYGTTACKWDSVISFDEMWKRLNKLKRNSRTPVVLFGSEPFSSTLRLSNLKNYKYDWVYKKSKAQGFMNAKKMPLKNVENIMIFYNKLPTYNPQGTKKVNIVKNNSTKQIKNHNVAAQNGGSFKTKTYLQTTSGYPTQILGFKSSFGYHQTQKPVALMEYLIKTYTNEGETVLDFTAGSGTTGVACINTNRNCILIEKDNDIFNIAKDRINKCLS